MDTTMASSQSPHSIDNNSKPFSFNMMVDYYNYPIDNFTDADYEVF